MATVTINVNVDTLYNANGTLSDAVRTVTLNGVLSSDKLVFDNGTNDLLTIQGNGVVCSSEFAMGASLSSSYLMNLSSAGYTSAMHIIGGGTYGVYVDNGATSISLYGRHSVANGTSVRARNIATTGSNLGLFADCTGSGATTNTGAKLTASGATNNYAIDITAGDINFSSAGTNNINLGGDLVTDTLNIQNASGTDILQVLGNGSVIVATTTSQKIGFYGVTPITQPSAVTTAQGLSDVISDLGLMPASTLVPSIQSVASNATVTPTTSDDEVIITAQAVNLTLANPTGTPAQGQAMMIRIKDDGTGRTITFGANYRALGITLPTTTVASKTMYLGLIYNATDSKWDILGLNEEA